jgi:hypothetical protein
MAYGSASNAATASSLSQDHALVGIGGAGAADLSPSISSSTPLDIATAVPAEKLGGRRHKRLDWYNALRCRAGSSTWGGRTRVHLVAWSHG